MANLAIKSVVVTGANRGVGLALVKQLVLLPKAPPQHVFATCRSPESATELQDLASKHSQIHIHKFDVVDYSSYPTLVRWVEGILGPDEGLTVLINNAGLGVWELNSLEKSTPDVMMQHFETNTIAPLMLSKAFLPLLKKAAARSTVAGLSVAKAAIINMSTLMASMDDNTSGGIYAYRSSKTALNMVTKSLSVDLKPDGILVVPLHPGWVKTGMGGPNAKVDADTSAQGLLEVMGGLTENDTGCFYNYMGKKISW